MIFSPQGPGSSNLRSCHLSEEETVSAEKCPWKALSLAVSYVGGSQNKSVCILSKTNTIMFCCESLKLSRIAIIDVRLCQASKCCQILSEKWKILAMMEFSSTDCGYYKTEKNLQLEKHVNKTWLVAQNLNFRSKSRQIARDHTALVVNLIFPHNVIVGIFSTWKDPLHVSRVVDEPIPRLNDALKHLGLPVSD